MTRFAPLALAAALVSLGCAHAPSQRDLEAAEIHYDLGANLLGQGRAQEALKEFLSALERRPDFPEVHNGLGLLYHWSYQRLDEAEMHFRRALELKPKFPDAWNNLGALLAQKNELAGARAAFAEALADPLYTTPHIAQTNLAWVVHLQGDDAGAESLARAALGTAPNYCAGHRQLARLLEAQSRRLDADASWEAFAQHCPEEPEALLRLAEVQARRGQSTEASRTLLRCLEKAGVKPVASECRKLLASLPPLPVEKEPELRRAEPTDAGASVEGARDLGDRR